VIFTIPCKTAGAPLSNTILTSGTFKNVTIAADGSGRKRGITVTPNTINMECGGITTTTKIAGKIIGRITNDPAPSPSGCGVVDSEITLEFLIRGGLQTPMVTDDIPSTKDDLSAQTGSEAVKTAALEDKMVLSTVSPTTWTCNAC
jgi:hypothetical protein